MAGDDDAYRVASGGGSDGAGRAGPPDGGRQFAVGGGSAVSDSFEGLPHGSLEGGADGFEREVELPAGPLEVFGELSGGGGQGVLHALPQGARGRGSAVPRPVDGAEPALVRHDGQGAQGRLGQRVDHAVLLSTRGRRNLRERRLNGSLPGAGDPARRRRPRTAAPVGCRFEPAARCRRPRGPSPNPGVSLPVGRGVRLGDQAGHLAV